MSPRNFDLTSSAFASEETIPDKYGCQGAGISPPLAWSDAPEGTKGFVLVCEDPDSAGGTFTHWLLYNMPPATDTLSEGVETEPTLSWGAAQGRNDFGNVGYGGPCPPRGSTHRYYFRLYALDERLDMVPGASRGQLLSVIDQHILASAELMGRYGRR
jgi:Raf kinase inhibitor-like YbhB/YbcL family protein